jgi:MHS family proline/betaine transporter-like MFS transporter
LMISTIGLIAFLALIPIAGALSDRIGRKPMLMGSCIGYVLLTFPLFWMASLGSFTLALVAQLVLVFMLALYVGPGPATYAEMIPTPVRYTAVSIGFSTTVAAFGGTTPLVAAFLIKLTGYPLAPTFYVVAAAALTLLVLRPMKETAFTPLG